MELRADERALAIFEEAIPATEQDWERNSRLYLSSESR